MLFVCISWGFWWPHAAEEGNAAIDETPAATVVSDEPVEPKAEPPAATAEKKDDADDSAEATEDGEDTKKTEAEMQESLAQVHAFPKQAEHHPVAILSWI